MVLYFTGTGNSRYLARRIAEGLEMPLYDLNACIKAGDTAPVQIGRDVVLVTPPTHGVSPGGVGVAGQDQADRGRAHLVCDGLWQRNWQCGRL